MPETAGKPSNQGFPHIHPLQEQLRFLVHYAILAPSTRNTQPWRFAVGSDRIDVLPDLSRAHPVADDDRRELYASLGCAIENLLIAAEAFGFRPSVAYSSSSEDIVVARMSFLPGRHRSSQRDGLGIQTILRRRTAHGGFRPEPLPEGEVAALLDCAAGEGLELSAVSDADRLDEIAELHYAAQATAFADPAFRHELALWVGAGGFGTPWPICRVGQAVLESELLAHHLAKRETATVRAAPLLLLISSMVDDRPSQVRAGQILERIWLVATARGLALQPLSAALEIPRLRGDLSRLMNARLPWAQQLVRVGHPRRTRATRTPRRPLDDVLDPLPVG